MGCWQKQPQLQDLENASLNAKIAFDSMDLNGDGHLSCAFVLHSSIQPCPDLLSHYIVKSDISPLCVFFSLVVCSN